MRVAILAASLLLALTVPAGAAVVLINNGLDCSHPGNVIDDATYRGDDVVVRNVGCGTPDPGSPCPSPGGATEVCVEAGGEVYGLWAYDSSAITMNEGTVAEWIDARGSSSVTMNAGAAEGGIAARGSSAVTMNGGTVNGFVYVFGSSSFAMNGGALGEGWQVLVSNSATFTVTGTDFAVDGSPVAHGDLGAQTGTLTGRLVSGDPIDAVFDQGGSRHTGTITLASSGQLVVPSLSPSGSVLLAAVLLGSALMWRRRLRVA
jgi:hypothetical protein